MAKASEPAVRDDDIFFELERFEPADGRLALSGRWFGVRGRRFVRPTLTLAVAGERMRALADLDDKPWAAEDGEPWQASFPWGKTGPVEEPELSVAPDITIPLPAPGSRRTRSQRLAAQPRRAAMTASWGSLVATIEAPAVEEADEAVLTAPEPEPAVDAAPAAGSAVGAAPEAELDAAEPEPEPAPPEPDPVALQTEVEALRIELGEARSAAGTARRDLAALQAELSGARTELEETQRQRGHRDADLQTVQGELAEMRAARDAALRGGAQAEADRDEALTRAGELEAERNALLSERAQLIAELGERRAAVDQLTRQQAEAAAARGAALVMRGATQALPAYDHHVGWVRRGAAVVVPLGIIFAVLILLHVL